MKTFAFTLVPYKPHHVTGCTVTQAKEGYSIYFCNRLNDWINTSFVCNEWCDVVGVTEENANDPVIFEQWCQ